MNNTHKRKEGPSGTSTDMFLIHRILIGGKCRAYTVSKNAIPSVLYVALLDQRYKKLNDLSIFQQFFLWASSSQPRVFQPIYKHFKITPSFNLVALYL